MESRDDQLLQRWAQDRDEAAFAALVARHGGMVLAVARRVVGSTDAEDVSQAAFLILARQAGRVAPGVSLAGWLHTTARRLALHHRETGIARRRREREGAMPTSVDPSEPDEGTAASIDAAIAALPERYRVPLVLHHLEGHAQAAIAERLGVAEGTVASWLARGRDRLADLLRRRGVAIPAVALSTLLADQAAAAATPIFIANTTGAAVSFATGSVSLASSGGTSLALAQHGIHLMAIAKAKLITTATLVVLSVTGVGSYAVVRHLAAEGEPVQVGSTPVPATPRIADADLPAPDLLAAYATLTQAWLAVPDLAESRDAELAAIARQTVIDGITASIDRAPPGSEEHPERFLWPVDLEALYQGSDPSALRNRERDLGGRSLSTAFAYLSPVPMVLSAITPVLVSDPAMGLSGKAILGYADGHAEAVEDGFRLHAIARSQQDRLAPRTWDHRQWGALQRLRDAPPGSTTSAIGTDPLSDAWHRFPTDADARDQAIAAAGTRILLCCQAYKTDHDRWPASATLAISHQDSTSFDPAPIVRLGTSVTRSFVYFRAVRDEASRTTPILISDPAIGLTGKTIVVYADARTEILDDGFRLHAIARWLQGRTPAFTWNADQWQAVLDLRNGSADVDHGGF